MALEVRDRSGFGRINSVSIAVEIEVKVMTAVEILIEEVASKLTQKLLFSLKRIQKL